MATEVSVTTSGGVEETFGATAPTEDTFSLGGTFALFAFMVIPVGGDPFAPGSGYQLEESAASVTRVEESRA
jgi:hypothetical protein